MGSYIHVAMPPGYRFQADIDPIEMFSELDDLRMEIRKVHIFIDKHFEYAAENVDSQNTRLSIEPIPSIAEINEDPQFSAKDITAAEFENVWLRAVEDSRPSA